MDNTVIKKNRAAKIYLKRIKKVCPHKIRHKLYSDLSDSLFEYIESNPDATYEKLECEFGSPEDFTAEYLNSMDNDKLVRLMNKSVWIKRCSMAVGIVFIVTIIIAGIMIVLENSKSAAYTYTVVIEYGTTSIYYESPMKTEKN